MTSDRELLRRLTVAVVFIFLFTAAYSGLYRLYARKFFDVTSPANWIWPVHQISQNTPLAFFAVREFDLPKWRQYTRLKIAGDPEYTVYFNGQEVGRRRVAGDRYVDIYDVTPIAREAGNRIVVAVRSPVGVGGLIASVDITPEVENLVATDTNWKIFRRWSDDLPVRDSGAAARPMTFGEPPAGRWNYLVPQQRPLARPISKVIQPASQVSARAYLGEIAVRDGVHVAGRRAVRATAYDFGPTAGRVRLTLVGTNAVAPTVGMRLMNALDEVDQIDFQPRRFVFAPGETSVTDPEAARFRYVLVYGSRARAEVVQ